MFNFFKKKVPQVPQVTPLKHEKWSMSSDGSPWPIQGSEVTILDCKDGWVRYKMNYLFKDERMRLDLFLKIYAKVEE